MPLLLGRPWQYDRKVSHDGYKNTHSFVKDGVQIVLVQFKQELKDSKEVGSSFLIGSQLEHALTNQDEVFATTTQQAPYHEFLLPLLEESYLINFMELMVLSKLLRRLMTMHIRWSFMVTMEFQQLSISQIFLDIKIMNQ